MFLKTIRSVFFSRSEKWAVFWLLEENHHLCLGECVCVSVSVCVSQWVCVCLQHLCSRPLEDSLRSSIQHFCFSLRFFRLKFVALFNLALVWCISLYLLRIWANRTSSPFSFGDILFTTTRCEEQTVTNHVSFFTLSYSCAQRSRFLRLDDFHTSSW